MVDEREDVGADAEGLWERMRAEERADQLAQVVQDAARDAKVAALLDAGPAGRRSS